MTSQARIKKVLLRTIQNHEAYIRSDGTKIKQGTDYANGHYDHAEYELLEHIKDAFGDDVYWDFDPWQPWFVALVWRQAKCNFYESE